MELNPKQVQAVLALSDGKRFEHFVKVVADRETVWGLFQDGWALAADDGGTRLFPLWPAREYAELCAINEWARYAPRSFSVDELLNVLLPKLQSDGVLAAVFVTPSTRGVPVEAEELRRAISAELDRF